MAKSRTRLDGVIVAFVGIASSPLSVAAEPVEPNTALAIITSLESEQSSRIKNARWKMGGPDGHSVDPNDIDRFVPDKRDPKVYFNHNVHFEPATGRYRYEIGAVMRCVDGIDPYEPAVEIRCLDGRIERYYKRGQAGTKVPGLDVPGVGVIRLERKNGFLDQGGLVSGIGYFQPNHFSRRFSEFLEERTSRRLNVDRNQDGTWMITTTTPQEVHSADSYFPIGYDPVRCLVVWAEWVGNENAQSPWAGKPWKRHVVKWKELKEGLWVPSTISQVNVIDRTISRGEFQDVQVNEHLDESTYSFSYPVSTRMTDEVEKTIYVVS